MLLSVRFSSIYKAYNDFKELLLKISCIHTAKIFEKSQIEYIFKICINFWLDILQKKLKKN